MGDPLGLCVREGLDDGELVADALRVPVCEVVAVELLVNDAVMLCVSDAVPDTVGVPVAEGVGD